MKTLPESHIMKSAGSVVPRQGKECASLHFTEILKVIFLGIVEGITEWLPISSTGHMLLVDEFLQLAGREEFKEMFFVVIQFGAILAVILLFFKKMWPFQTTQHGERPFYKQDIILTWLKVVVTCIPGVIATLLFDDYIEAHFHTPVVIAAALIFYGIGFLLVESRKRGQYVREIGFSDISFRTAFLIGLFQVLSIIPGTSRSGSTIIGALLLGVSRQAAAEYSFFLAAPVVFGLSAIKLLKFGFAFSTQELVILLIGMIVAFAVSLLVIRFLMNYIKKHDFKLFGWYRIVLGALVLLYFFAIK